MQMLTFLVGQIKPNIIHFVIQECSQDFTSLYFIFVFIFSELLALILKGSLKVIVKKLKKILPGL